MKAAMRLSDDKRMYADLACHPLAKPASMSQLGELQIYPAHFFVARKDVGRLAA